MGGKIAEVTAGAKLVFGWYKTFACGGMRVSALSYKAGAGGYAAEAFNAEGARMDNIFLLVETFSPEQHALIKKELSGAPKSVAELFIAGDTTSTLDLAWKLFEMERLPEWGAAIALVQSAGRGQFRREWVSPQGNLHVSFRLPESGIFESSAATVILGLLFCEAFDSLGLKLSLKWPNDLVLEGPDGPGKLGGILLEEKNGILLAGVGINVTHIPGSDGIRPGSALPSVFLPENFAFRTPIRLWLTLVHSLIMRYNDAFMANSRSAFLRRAEERLLWRGREVLVSGESGSDEPVYGTVTGLSDEGGLVLLTRGANGVPISREITSGSIAGV